MTGERRMSAAEMAGIRRILFIQTAFLGDVVFSTALLRGCRDLFPDSEITLLASPRGGGILEGDPVVKEVVYFDKKGRDRGPSGLFRVIRSLRRRNFDLVVSPHPSFRSALVGRLAGAGLRLGFRSAATWWAWNLGIRDPAAEQRPYRREMMLLESVAGRSLPNRPCLHASEREKAEAKELFAASGLSDRKPVVAFATGTVWPTKKWPVESYVKLGREIVSSGMGQVVVIGGSEEVSGTAPFVAERGIVNLTGKTALRQLPAVLERCSVLVAGDTGPLHAAMALGVRVVALFGPTAENQFEFGDADRCLVADLVCRPCRPHGSVHCPEEDWRCMTDIPVRSVREAVAELLGL
jgi:lipopolysaccharide heptosyltransferase II